MAATAAVFYAETVLSLTPILIKLVPTNLSTQTLSRFLIYPLAALLIGGIGPLRDVFGTSLTKTLAAGSINAAHVASSYYAFSALPTGIAMSLFYTYPLWNLIGASLFFGESFPWHLLPAVAIALAGTFLVVGQARNEKKEIHWDGVAAALGAALTETGLFLTVKGAKFPTPLHNIHQFYLGGLPLILLFVFSGIGGTGSGIDLNWRHWIPLIAFNGLLGFSGYAARFWSIPRLPTIVYTVLSLFGVLASFLWGALFIGERVAPLAIAGSGILAAAIGYIRWYTK